MKKPILTIITSPEAKPSEVFGQSPSNFVKDSKPNIFDSVKVNPEPIKKEIESKNEEKEDKPYRSKILDTVIDQEYVKRYEERKRKADDLKRVEKEKLQEFAKFIMKSADKGAIDTEAYRKCLQQAKEAKVRQQREYIAKLNAQIEAGKRRKAKLE